MPAQKRLDIGATSVGDRFETRYRFPAADDCGVLAARSPMPQMWTRGAVFIPVDARPGCLLRARRHRT
jgi:hypothetical protein